MAKVKYVLLLPLTYNDKSKVPKKVLNRFLDELFCLAGGYTIAGTVEGAYRMRTGSKQVDRTLQVWVVVDEKDQDDLKDMVADFAGLLGQESIYLERVSSTVEFISPKEDGDLEP